MPCWRALELSDQPDESIVPHLLVKSHFGESSYTVHVTCLSNIWSEQLDLQGIVSRAADEQSPIEISKQDVTQLSILLSNIEKTLTGADYGTCRISQAADDKIILHTSIALPAPLDHLTWKFELKKQTSATLKNELILPLLISSHIQHERINKLITVITDKDKALTRLIDQFESSNLDLTAAFPVLGSLKAGRRTVKREQAVKHVPALRQFSAQNFNNETASLQAPDVTTFGLFREALSECNPTVPPRLKANPDDNIWWANLPTKLGPAPTQSRSKPKKTATPVPDSLIDGESGEETEDEFEVHENFKTRNVLPRDVDLTKPKPESLSPVPSGKGADKEPDLTEDEDDLDAPPRSQSQTNNRSVRIAKSTGSPSKRPSSPPREAVIASEAKVNSKTFRIGGKSKTSTTDLAITNRDFVAPSEKQLLSGDSSAPQVTSRLDITPKKSKRVFKIGGKGKDEGIEGDHSNQNELSHVSHTRALESSDGVAPSPPPALDIVKEAVPAKEEPHGETAEEKAERRRAELKRKTDETAKKQAQQKKKRRF